jgi:hypothetical protein
MLESGEKETWNESMRVKDLERKRERCGERGKKKERERETYEPVQERECQSGMRGNDLERKKKRKRKRERDRERNKGEIERE